MQSLIKVWLVLFYKAQNDKHSSTPEAIGIDYLAFELSKLRFRRHNLLIKLGS